MSSYQALLSLISTDWIGGGEFDGTDAAAVSSYLSFDAGVACDEVAADQQVPETLLLDTPQADCYCASGVDGSSSEGQPGKQSHQADASALSSEPHDNGFTTSASAGAGAGTGSPLLPLPATAARKGGGGGNRKVAFKTRSEVEVLDDGYRWRKYGKKLVKNSPNPRNYRCSTEGCAVKKRVERARDDASFVITTYDGVHNHPAAPAPAPHHHHCLRDYRLLVVDPPPTTSQQQGHRGETAPSEQEQQYYCY